MNLAPIMFFAMLAVGIGAIIFVSANYGLYTYLLTFHMSPHRTWWADIVPDLRYLLIVGLIALVAATLARDPFPNEFWLKQNGLRIIVIFNLWLWALNLWVLSPFHIEGCVLFAKHLAITYITYRLCKNDMDVMKKALLAIVVGCGWIGWQALGKSGRVEGVAGALADANTLGTHSAVGVLLASMMLLDFRGYYRWVPFLCIPLILNTVILASSRGGFLGLLAGGMAAMYFCPKPLQGRFRLLGILGLVLFFMLAHEQFLERMQNMFLVAIGEVEEVDHSASSRMEVAKAGWQMALDYPMGAGHKGHALLSPLYMDESLLTDGDRVGVSAARAAHNSFLAALVEYGFVGVFLYAAMYIWSVGALLRMKRFAAKRNDVELGIITAAIAAGLSVVLVAGQFSSYVYVEVQFWLFGMLAGLSVMVQRTLNATARVEQARQRQAPMTSPVSG